MWRWTSLFGSRAFSIAAAQACNQLPADIRNTATYSTFKYHLQAFLFSVGYGLWFLSYSFLGFTVDLLNCLGLVVLIVKHCRSGLCRRCYTNFFPLIDWLIDCWSLLYVAVTVAAAVAVVLFRVVFRSYHGLCDWACAHRASVVASKQHSAHSRCVWTSTHGHCDWQGRTYDHLFV